MTPQICLIFELKLTNTRSLDMGGCTPISKARRAQELGAAGLIITTHNCLCSENCTDEEHCIDELPHLHDDGTGESVSIPTMIISHGKASHLKAAIRKGNAVLMEMAWHEPKMEHTVRADFWYAPNHKSTEEFLANFSGLAHTLGEHLDFRPHHYILDGHRMQCEGQSDDPKQPCFNMCTNNGRYCYVSYGYNHHGISGKDVVTESLRRMCLIKHHTPGVFWEYVNHFQTMCDSIDYFANKDCVKDALKHSNVKEKAIEECMKDSGDVATDQTNSLLEVAMEASARTIETPTVHINGMPMKWPLNTRAVFESICLGYQTGKAPHVCAACAMCGDPVACASRAPMHCIAQDGRIPDSKKSSTGGKKSGGGFGHFVLVVLILTGIGGVVYYKKFMEDGDRPSYSGYSLGEALMSDTA